MSAAPTPEQAAQVKLAVTTTLDLIKGLPPEGRMTVLTQLVREIVEPVRLSTRWSYRELVEMLAQHTSVPARLIDPEVFR